MSVKSPYPRALRSWLFAAVLIGLWTIGPSPGSAQDIRLPQSDSVDEAEPREKIAADAAPGEDQRIKRRLQDIFSQLEGVEDLRVDVRSGVVSLYGEVPTQNARTQALKLARQVEGVVEVDDNTTLGRDVGRQIAPAFERLREFSSDIFGYVPLVAFAVVIFLCFWLAAFMIGKWQGLYRRFTGNQFLADFLRQLVQFAVLALGLLVVFEFLDASTLVGTVLGAAGLVGLALGFALRDTVENYIAGILLSTKHPFVHDDWVDIEGHEGHVLRLTSRATIIMTLDGNHIRIPNAKVFNGVIINYTRNPQRRFSFSVGISVEANIQSAQLLAARTLVDMEGVLDDPAPNVDVESLGESNVILRVFGWVDQRRFSFLKVQSEAIRLVKEAFDAAGIVMPVPIVNVRMQEARGADASARSSAGSRKATDIDRAANIQSQIAEDRAESREPDLLRSNAPLE